MACRARKYDDVPEYQAGRADNPRLRRGPFLPSSSGIKRGQNRWVFRQGPGQKYTAVQTH
jgi:hypothetical protein